jgi:GNAT superfamily N-acetyltransferase
MIRSFEPGDTPTFLRLAQQLHDEGVVRELKFDAQAMRRMLEQPGLFIELAFDGDEPVGLFTGFVQETFFGPDVVAHQHLMYIVPSHRGGMLATRMMHRFETWALLQGAKEVWVSQATGIRPERTRKLFEALGFGTVGFIARKAV